MHFSVTIESKCKSYELHIYEYILVYIFFMDSFVNGQRSYWNDLFYPLWTHTRYIGWE
jgi:hypothetical protein